MNEKSDKIRTNIIMDRKLYERYSSILKKLNMTFSGMVQDLVFKSLPVMQQVEMAYDEAVKLVDSKGQIPESQANSLLRVLGLEAKAIAQKQLEDAQEQLALFDVVEEEKKSKKPKTSKAPQTKQKPSPTPSTSKRATRKKTSDA